MFALGKHKVLSGNPTIEEIAGHTADFFMSDWKTSYNYNQLKPIISKSKEIDQEWLKKSAFLKSTLYVQSLAAANETWRLDEIDETTRKELKTWDGRGGFCIYTSVLLWCLLYESGLFEDDQLKLVQGFYKHPTQGFLTQLIAKPPPLQIGLHSWVHADGRVLDFSIIQERSCFDFNGEAYIMGNIPKGMELVGWEEGKVTVKKYAREIAKESGFNYYDWVMYHKLQANFKVGEMLRKWDANDGHK